MTSLQARQPTDHSSAPGGRLNFSFLQTVQTYCRAHWASWRTNSFASLSAPERILTFTRGWLQSEYSEILLPLVLIGSSAGAERVNTIRGCHSEGYFIREKYIAILQQPTNVFISYFFSNMIINCVITILHKLPDLWSTTHVQNGCRPMVHRTATAAPIRRTPSFFEVTKFPNRQIHKTTGLCSIDQFFDYSFI